MKYLTTQSYRPANLMNDVDRVFNQFYTGNTAPSHRGFKVDIAETVDGYRIISELPGFTAEDIDVRVEDNLLVIEARTLENTEKKDKEEDKITWFVKERKPGNLKRSFVLPDDVKRNDVGAEMKNGILTVSLTKKPEAKPLTVKVQGK